MVIKGEDNKHDGKEDTVKYRVREDIVKKQSNEQNLGEVECS